MPAELKYLPASAFDLLAALYNAVEDGAPWPGEVLKARAVALPKTEQVEIEDPLKFRLLMMTSA
eukprot:14455771-Alexandrium_andersonii.AAC.1